MEFSNYTNEQLLQVIEELKMLNDELLSEKEKEASLDFAWTGNLGHWYWNIKYNSVVFNPLKIKALGYCSDELPEKVEYQFFTDKLHPDDYQNTMDAMVHHLKGNNAVYEAEYRIQAKDKTWKWFYDRGKVTQRDSEGKPLFVSGIVFDITDKKEEENKRTMHLKQVSITDELTGLKNRGAIIGELEADTIHFFESNQPLSIAMIDIDYFKEMNDTKGHTFGDQILRKLGSILSDAIRGLDTVGRYGGDEFLIIFPNTSCENAFSVCERLRKRVEDFDFGEGFKLSISGGVAEYKDEEITEFIDRADQQLYAAKKSGKNKIMF